MHGPLALSLCAFVAASNTAAQTSFNPLPLRAVMNDDVRVLWMGDSFAVPWADRVSGAMLLTWPIRDWTSFTIGSGPSWFFVGFDELDGGIGSIDAVNQYRLFDTGPDAGSGDRYALPLWKMREWHPGPGGGDGETPLLEVTYREITRYSAVDDFAESGDEIRLTPLAFDAPGSRPAATLRFSTDDGEVLVAPADPPRDGHVRRAEGTMLLTAQQGGNWAFSVSALGGGYAHMPGFTMTRLAGGERAPGLDWGVLADSSWSFDSFGLDLPAGPGTPTKTFSREQLARWLGATSVDDERPVFVFYYLAIESAPAADLADQVGAMVEQTEAAAGDAGIGPVHHCVVIPHYHVIGMPDGDVLNPGRFTDARDVSIAFAQTREDISVLSIYDYSDGFLFDGSPEPNQWLLDRGFDHLVYGDRTVDLVNEHGEGRLLDHRALHPANKGALAFAWMAAQIIIDACPADFAAPYGELDLRDLSGFIDAFVGAPYRADLAEPRGLVDLLDLQRFVGSFLLGCEPD